ncbi:yippee-like protein [Cladorrhinum sp. PSN332]|nr:yippee-like protein [Cladorrhinum sp. PSN332]
MFSDLISLRSPPPPEPSVDSGPIFPLYLLPSTFKFPFRRRQPLDTLPPLSSSSSPPPSLSSSPSSSTGSSAGSSSPRLSRTSPSTIRCTTCRNDIAFHSQIVSKGFHGRYGRAYLVSPSPAPTTHNQKNTTTEKEREVLPNTYLSRPETRQLVTGSHVVADLFCKGCNTRLGWKYVDASDQGQKYKVGKFILEVARVTVEHSWEDVAISDNDDTDPAVVVFDSDDEDECDDIFAGVWDPEVTAKRREKKVANNRKKGRA